MRLAVIWTCLLVGLSGCDETVVVAADRDAATDSGPEPVDAGRDAADSGADAGADGCGALARLEGNRRGELGPSSPTWQRPSAVLGCPTQPTAIEVPYDAHVYCAVAAGDYEIAVRVEEPMHTLDEPVVFAYRGESIPSDSTLCVALSSRDEAQLLSRDAVIDRLPLAAGDVVTVVVSADTRTGSFGTYELRARRLP